MNTLYKNIVAAMCCTMALSAQAQTTPRTFQRNKVLIEKHTGQGCGNCPSADATLKNYLTNSHNKGNVAILRHHSYSNSDGLYMQFAQSLSSAWGISGWPQMMVDRYSFQADKTDRASHSFAATSVSSSQMVDKRMAEPTCVSLSFDGSSYDPQTKKLRITLSGEVTKDLPYLRVHAFLTQSNIQSYQRNGSKYEQDYIHDDASRAFLMKDVHGDALVPKDGKYSVNFETTLQGSYGGTAVKEADMKVVAFVSSYVDDSNGYWTCDDYSTSEVHNADVVSITDLPSSSPCASPAISFADGKVVCQSTTPDATCTHEVKPFMQTSDSDDAALNLDAPAFTVTAYAEAPGYARSLKSTRTFTLREVLGTGGGNASDVNGDGQVNKSDIEALARKILKM
ncbi:MAG: Omp28-related outer membrane protein [Bacteroidales bacterium]|nr:Omp28-related outer membrane protein [Candidatus Physcousia equi]